MKTDLKKMYVGVKKDSKDRRKDDLYETPPIASWILHKYAPPPNQIVEPCAGRGNISAELLRCGYQVESYDLNDHPNKVSPVTTGQDVLNLSVTDSFSKALVTNPPYFKDLPRKILQKGISEFQYTALFVRLTFLEGIKRKEIFSKTPPSDLIIFSDRIKFLPNMTKEPIEQEEQIGGMICYCWVVFDKRKLADSTKLTWISLKDEYPEWRQHYEETKS